MATIYRKSLHQVGLSIGGNVISEGGGDGEFVTVTSPERAGSKAGVHGDAVLYDTPNPIYEVTVTLIETAVANRVMQSLYNAQVERTFEGTLDFMLEDTGTAETLSGQAVITKEPDRAKAAEAANYQWTLHVASQSPWGYSDRVVIVP
jgi:hypothetical protein